MVNAAIEKFVTKVIFVGGYFVGPVRYFCNIKPNVQDYSLICIHFLVQLSGVFPKWNSHPVN